MKIQNKLYINALTLHYKNLMSLISLDHGVYYICSQGRIFEDSTKIDSVYDEKVNKYVEDNYVKIGQSQRYLETFKCFFQNVEKNIFKIVKNGKTCNVFYRKKVGKYEIWRELDLYPDVCKYSKYRKDSMCSNCEVLHLSSNLLKISRFGKIEVLCKKCYGKSKGSIV